MLHAAIVIHGSVVVRSLARVIKYVNQQTLLLAIILALVTTHRSKFTFQGRKYGRVAPTICLHTLLYYARVTYMTEVLSSEVWR